MLSWPVLLLLLLTSMLCWAAGAGIYFAAGISHNVTRKNAEGLDALPNIVFVRQTPMSDSSLTAAFRRAHYSSGPALAAALRPRPTARCIACCH